MTDNKGFWRIPPASKGELRTFGLVMALAAGAIALLLWYKQSMDGAWKAGLVAIGFAGLAMSWAQALKPLNALWMLFARILGFVNSHILLALVFYTLFSVIGLAMRLFRHDPLDRKLEAERESYWSDRESTQRPRNHFERQF